MSSHLLLAPTPQYPTQEGEQGGLHVQELEMTSTQSRDGGKASLGSSPTPLSVHQVALQRSISILGLGLCQQRVELTR